MFQVLQPRQGGGLNKGRYRANGKRLDKVPTNEKKGRYESVILDYFGTGYHIGIYDI